MTTYYLKAATEADLWDALETAGLAYKQYDMTDPLNIAPEDQNLYGEPFMPTGAFEWVSKSNMLDIIGTIYTPTGTMLTDTDGNEYPEMAALDGFHANLREVLTEEQAAALPTIPAPTHPVRKWAGDK